MDTVDQVMRYIAAGLPVLPLHAIVDGRCTCGWDRCHSPGKHPRIPAAHRRDDPQRHTCTGGCGRPGHGLHDATTDTGTVAEWLGTWRHLNWGARPPQGLIVVDVDVRNNGHRSLADLETEHGPLPSTLTAKTGGGGWHHWLIHNAPARGKLAPGIDIKTHTGFVVIPPSNHISGHHYTWTNQAPAAHAPRWVANMLNPPVRRYTGTPTGGNLDALIRFVLEAEPGARNSRLYWAACRANESGLDTTPLIDAYTSLGKSHHEAAATVRSAEHAPPRKASAA